MKPVLAALARATGRQNRIVDRYVMLVALRAITLVAAALVALLSVFDFVEQLGLVGQGHYNVANAFSDMLLTAPSRLLQVAPVSMLLGSLLAFGPLARNAELTAMLSMGISEQRILRSVVLLVIPATFLLFMDAEYVIPAGQRLAYMQRTAAIAAPLHRAEGGAWAHGEGSYLNIGRLEGDDAAAGIDIYRFAPDGSLRDVIHADHARVGSNMEWQLTGVTRSVVRSGQFVVDHPATLTWHGFLTPPALRNLFLPVDSISPSALYGQLRAAARLGQDVPRLQQAFWDLAGIPLSMLAMTMLVASIAFQPTRTQSTASDLTRAMAFSVVYSLSQQILGRVGVLLRLNPQATTLAPSLIVIGLAIWLFRDRLGRR